MPQTISPLSPYSQVLDVFLYGGLCRMVGGLAVDRSQKSGVTELMRKYLHGGE